MDSRAEVMLLEGIPPPLREMLDVIGADVRQSLNAPGEIECQTWVGEIERTVMEEEHRLPDTLTLFHCHNGPVSDPHHWVEGDFTEGSTKGSFIWDDTGQKLKGERIIRKAPGQGIWNGYFEADVSRQQFYPEFIDTEGFSE